jgi:4-alpha-glucanotransferase
MDGRLRRADVETERINLPANPTHYWRYRMHLTLESLVKAEEFNGRLGEMLRENRR